MELVPAFVDAEKGARLAVMSGWWAVAEDGTPVAGPYPTEEAAKIGIAKRGADQPTGHPNAAGPPPLE